MFRILHWMIWGALAMGVGEAGYKTVIAMASKAANTQQHDQISYSKWNRMLWTGKAEHGLNR